MKMNLLYFLASIALAIGSCGGSATSEPVQVKAPSLLSSVPADGAVGVEFLDHIDMVLTFNQNIECRKPVSIDNGASVDQVKTSRNQLTLTLGNLKGNSSYKLFIPAGAICGFKENQKSAEAIAIQFTTEEDMLASFPYDKMPVPEDNAAWKMFSLLGLGWNMGNHFDAFLSGEWAGDKALWPDETCWGCPKCTRATFTKVAEAGFKSVRIPITWLNTIGDAPDYRIDEAWMNRIVEVVGWARDAGLYVIINTHHDEDHYYGNESMGHRWLDIIDATADESVNAAIKEKIRGFWANVANTFKDEGDYLIFESFNEINDGKWGSSPDTDKQAAVLNQWNQVFVDAVRSTGGNNATRWLGVPTYAANPGLTKYFIMPEDPAGRTMLAVHCYDPYNYTLAAGLPQQYWGEKNHKAGDEDALRNVFVPLYDNFVAKGIPVYMGEFGCSMRDYNKTKEWKNYLYYLAYFVQCSKSYGIPCFLWDNGNHGFGSEHHAYIDHGTGEFIDHSEEPVRIMVNIMK